jgi:hypothetical protein
VGVAVPLGDRARRHGRRGPRGRLVAGLSQAMVSPWPGGAMNCPDYGSRSAVTIKRDMAEHRP